MVCASFSGVEMERLFEFSSPLETTMFATLIATDNFEVSFGFTLIVLLI